MLLRKVTNLIDSSERWRLLIVLLMMLANAVMEVVGVATIMPFMSLVANPDVVHQDGVLAEMYRRAGSGDPHSFLAAVGVLVLCAITLSNVVAAYTTWLILRFVARNHHRLSQTLLERYLHAPYAFFLGRNTAELSKNILEEASAVMNGAVLPLMQLLAKGIVALFILALLYVVNFATALVVTIVFGGAYGLVYFGARRKQRDIGQERLAANALRYKIAAEALGGIKDVKVLGREQEFVDRFSVPSNLYTRHAATHGMLGLLPRYALEAVAFGSILILVILLLAANGEVSTVLPMVSLYALAGYRLMPALQQVYHGVSQLRFYGPVLEAVNADINRLTVTQIGRATQQAGDALPFTDRLELKRATFKYDDAATPALKNLSLTVPKNCSVALVGETGSGKSTAVDLILGLHALGQGALEIDGHPLSNGEFVRWRRAIGYVPQQIFLSDDTLRRNIAFGLADPMINETAVRRAARIANIDDFICSLPGGYDTIVGERGVRLSGGQRQRIGIARALYPDPELLILDEATSALDGVTEDTVMDAIRALAGRKTIILIAHRLSTVRECDRIYLMRDGSVVDSGTYAELLGTSELFRRMAHAADDARVQARLPAYEQGERRIERPRAGSTKS